MSLTLTQNPVELSRTLAKRLRVKRMPGDAKEFADAILMQLRADRLLWALAPRNKGGSGLSVGDAARVNFNVARLSGSAGLILAMHLSQALTVVRHGGDTPFFTALLDRMVHEQMLVASGTSEKGVGGDIFGSICMVEEASDGGLMVIKESPNISYLDHAGAVLVTAMRVEPKDRKSQVLIAADMSRMELRPGREAAFIGMRGILNRPYGFTARFTEAAIFADGYQIIARNTMTPSIHIFWAALWSGIACQVLDKAKAYLAKEAPADEAIAKVMRYELSRLVDRLHAMNALIRDAIADFEGRGADMAGAMGIAHTARVKRLKVSCSELLGEICGGALGLIGMRGYAEDGPYSLSEPLRDAMSAPVMISNYRLRQSNAEIERYIDEGL